MISEFPLFLFTLLGGAAAGAYAIAGVFPDYRRERRWVLPLIALVALAIGGIALLLHVGHPERMLNAFANPQAGITLEGFATIAFGVFVLVDLAFSMKGKTVKAISVFAGISGVLLLCAFGYAYAEYLAVAQWGSWQSYPLFILEGLAVGVSLIGVCAPQSYGNARLAVCAVVLLALSAVATVAEGAHFAACGALSAPFFVGAVLQVAAGAIVVAKRSQPATWVAPCVFALAFAGVAVARYAFYCM